jgi:hypothetical protein
MICRIWHGWTTEANADAYERLLRSEVFPGILRRKISGFQTIDLLRRSMPEGNDEALKEPHTRPMDFTGRPMKAYIYVGPNGVKTAAHLRKWLTRGQTFVASLPPAKRRVVHRASKTITHQPRRVSS